MTQRNEVLLKRAKELVDFTVIVQSKTCREIYIIGILSEVSDDGELTIFCLQNEEYFKETDTYLHIDDVFSIHVLDEKYQGDQCF